MSSNPEEGSNTKKKVAGIGLAAAVAAGIGLAAAVAAGIGLAAAVLGSGLEEPEAQDDRKKMKAPGTNGEVIYRDEFERNPSGYFHQLREDKKSKK